MWNATDKEPPGGTCANVVVKFVNVYESSRHLHQQKHSHLVAMVLHTQE